MYRMLICCLYIYWRVLYSGIWNRVVRWNSADVSEEQVACLLRASRWFLAWLILRPRRWRRKVSLKDLLTFNGLQKHYIPGDETLHNHSCKNLKSHTHPLIWNSIPCSTLTYSGTIWYCKPLLYFAQNRPDMSTTFNVSLDQLCIFRWIPLIIYVRCGSTFRTKTLPIPSRSWKLRQYVPLKHRSAEAGLLGKRKC
jgi:hypothetical protein